jgi:hypothetical protein
VSEQDDDPRAELGLLREGEKPEGSRTKDDFRALEIEAARLRGKRMTYREIGERMGTSYQTAWSRVQNAYKHARADATDVARDFERERLDHQYREAVAVKDEVHYLTAHGKVVLHPETGEPLIDPAPKLAALARMQSIAESYRKLEGLDQPTKVEQTGGLKVEIVGVDPSDIF